MGYIRLLVCNNEIFVPHYYLFECPPSFSVLIFPVFSFLRNCLSLGQHYLECLVVNIKYRIILRKELFLKLNVESLKIIFPAPPPNSYIQKSKTWQKLLIEFIITCSSKIDVQSWICVSITKVSSKESNCFGEKRFFWI